MPSTITDATTYPWAIVSTWPIDMVASDSTSRPLTITGRGPNRSIRVPPSGAARKPSRPIQANTKPTCVVGKSRTWAR